MPSKAAVEFNETILREKLCLASDDALDMNPCDYWRHHWAAKLRGGFIKLPDGLDHEALILRCMLDEKKRRAAGRSVSVGPGC